MVLCKLFVVPSSCFIGAISEVGFDIDTMFVLIVMDTTS